MDSTVKAPSFGVDSSRTAYTGPDDDIEVKGSRAQGLFAFVIGGAMASINWIIRLNSGSFYVSMGILGPLVMVLGLCSVVLPPPDHGKTRKGRIMTYTILGVIAAAVNLLLLFS